MTTDPSTPRLRMHIADPVARPDEGTAVKVVLPRDLRIQLHAHKLLDGVPITAAVTAALRHYFEELPRRRASEAGQVAPLVEG